MKGVLSRTLIISILTLCFTSETYSSHFLGGEIGWTCVKSGRDVGKFIFDLDFYHSCNWPCPASYVIVNPYYNQFGGPASIPVTQFSATEVTRKCYDKKSCGTNPTPRFSTIKNSFASSPIRLVGPDKGKSGVFSFTTCCRPSASLMWNTNGSGYYLKAEMHPYFLDSAKTQAMDYGDTIAKRSNCFDNSPRFVAHAQNFICKSYDTKFNVSAFDIDGDSLVYEWALPMQSSTNPVTWRSNYSLTSQFPDSSVNSKNVGAVLNARTGEISYKLEGPLNGYHTYSVVVHSYKNGQKVASVFRDNLFTIYDCDTAAIIKNTSPPNITLKPSNAVNWQSNYHDTIQLGDSIRLDLRSIDVGLLPLTGYPLQSVNIKVFGSAIADDQISQSKCSSPPCASIQALGTGIYDSLEGHYFDTSSVNVRIIWKPNCEHLREGLVKKGFAKVRTFNFVIRSYDNACPAPLMDMKMFTITVVDTSQMYWPLTKLDASNGGIRIEWDNSSNRSSFSGLDLYRYKGSKVSLLNTSNSSVNQYFDQGVDPALDTAVYELDLSSGSSCSKSKQYKNIVNTMSDSVGRLKFTWNSPYANVPHFPVKGHYYLIRKIGGQAEVVIDSLSFDSSALHFNAILPVYNDWVYYKIESKDANGFHAISNWDSSRLTRHVIDSLPERITGHRGVKDSTPPIDTTGNGIGDYNHQGYSVYPNPFRSELNIRVDGFNSSAEATLYDMKGNLVRAVLVNTDNASIETSGLQNGIYYLHISGVDGERIVKKLVKTE